MEISLFYTVVWIWIAVAVVVFPAALFVTAPYGRHSKNIGVMIPNRIAWILMESPSLFLFMYFFIAGTAEKTIVHWIFFALFSMHYINRTYIWPLKIRSKGKKMPLLIVLSAFGFNLMNGFINGYFLGNFAIYDINWLWSIPFIVGVSLFIFGFIVNVRSDNRLIGIRKEGETGYKIPVGGFFNYVSSPNIFGEIIEWLGWGIMTWSLPTLSFSIWTFANLLPRALDHHKWYKNNFEDYPKERKAVFPHIL
jgi:hypothetical protein